ncbi:MAG: 4Fe-4S dicluster domain-containing protein [Thermodesulfobacteriota bacterium]
MPQSYKIEVPGADLGATLKNFLGAILGLEEVAAMLVPAWLPMKDTVMPVLVTDPAGLETADPLAPAFPLNAARLASRLTRKPAGGLVAAVLRPCEIRAFVELVKLKQGSADDLVIIGLDCLGAFPNTGFTQAAQAHGRGLTDKFLASALGSGEGAVDGIEPAAACRVCERPLPLGADVALGLFGVWPEGGVLAEGRTERGAEILGRLGLARAGAPAARTSAVEALVRAKTKLRDEMFARTTEATSSLEKLTAYLAGCVNCYNCRNACPVCYCRECVFTTDVFDHEPRQYLQWARRQGTVKMPTDTVFYHLTRLAHMSTACVGCGQCSNACPNGLPVMELFRTLAARTQAAFDYEAGRSLEEAPPLSVFREDEFPEVTAP